ncbi:NAC domain-containing protein 78 [Rhynchospora pubera]|uniref:NAC domain-containing protein 78 n=1 Tax=Rhynchospora pubera TaxID=906938 RepID=A0AAV8E828_9POAL|nr:NAC domain-containing protein 78 [Rhynchospora pubera]
MAASSTLAPGFRFHPTDEELIIYYLKRKILNRPLLIDAISSVNLYHLEPWDLPSLARLQSNDQEWFFFCPLDRKNNSSQPRTNRATPRGYWKTTGKDREVVRRCDMKTVVGMKKTLVYHSGRAPRGKRTKWVMHEYKLLDQSLTKAGVCLDGLVVCRIFEKRGPGHQLGAQYGAPVAEEESEEEKGKEHEEEKEGVNEEVRGSPDNFFQLDDLHENLNENLIAGTAAAAEVSSQQNVHACLQNHADADIFDGLDGIDNVLNLSQPSDQFPHMANGFFEMDDFDASLLEVPPSQGLNSSTDAEDFNDGVQFFDSVDRFGGIDSIFNYDNFAEDDKFLFDAVETTVGGEMSGIFHQSDDFSQNNNGMNSDLLNSWNLSELADSTLLQPDGPTKEMGPSVQDGLSMTKLNNTRNGELSDMQDAVPTPVRYSPLSEGLVRFLDSFSPPPAFASEFVPANFKLVPKTISFSSAAYSKSKCRDVNSVVSRVLRGVLCGFFFLAIALTAGCKLAMCVRAN